MKTTLKRTTASAVIAAMLATGTLTGCASTPSNVRAVDVSPAVYKHLTCQELTDEYVAAAHRAEHWAHAQRVKAGLDGAMLGLGVLMPILFIGAAITGGNGAQTAKLAYAKGEVNAL
jgi:hypothetical protein